MGREIIFSNERSHSMGEKLQIEVLKFQTIETKEWIQHPPNILCSSLAAFYHSPCIVCPGICWMVNVDHIFYLKHFASNPLLTIISFSSGSLHKLFTPLIIPSSLLLPLLHTFLITKCYSALGIQSVHQIFGKSLLVFSKLGRCLSPVILIHYKHPLLVPML